MSSLSNQYTIRDAALPKYEAYFATLGAEVNKSLKDSADAFVSVLDLQNAATPTPSLSSTIHSPRHSDCLLSHDPLFWYWMGVNSSRPCYVPTYCYLPR